MKTKEIRSGLNQGRNIKYSRIMRNKPQQTLMDLLNMDQSEISRLENTPVVDKKILEKVAAEFDVDIKFLEEFVPDTVLGSYEQNNDIDIETMNDSASTNQIQDQKIETVNYDYSVPTDLVKDYMQEIKRLYKENADMLVLLRLNGVKYPEE